ncbi:glycosyltransferase family 4 protein [Schlegelella aquatica]|uniref:glycosyltransferase family 4 protein n=1 Tax=Caldimonas aquatica TaxID=376175 RepID=UPI0037525BC9
MNSRVLIVDQAVIRRSPAGSCVRAQVEGLLQQHRVTLLSASCDLPPHPALERRAVPIVPRPVLLRYVSFQVTARLAYLAHRLAQGRADLVQGTQGQLVGADIVYAHFCHRAYLRGPWAASGVTGARRWARWLNHRFNAWCEARALRRAACVVVPSRGLAQEIRAEYPHCAAKTCVIPNPVDVEHYCRPPDFDRQGARSRLGVPDEAVLLSFAALGDFHRKGLGLLIDALAALPRPHAGRTYLVVVGGKAGEIEAFRQHAKRAGVERQLRFVGFQDDVRPYLWASDVFVFPSSYETFSLVAHQAAAAGLPVMATRGLHGIEELIEDSGAGWGVERSAEAVCRGLQEVLRMRPEELSTMGERARQAVQRCHPEAFKTAWRELYGRMLVMRRTKPIRGTA